SSCATRAAMMEPPLPNWREMVIIGMEVPPSPRPTHHELIASEGAAGRRHVLEHETPVAQEAEHLLRPGHLEGIAAQPVVPIVPDGHPAPPGVLAIHQRRIAEVLPRSEERRVGKAWTARCAERALKQEDCK